MFSLYLVVEIGKSIREKCIYSIFLEAEAQNCVFKKFLMSRCCHSLGISGLPKYLLWYYLAFFVMLLEVSQIRVSFRLIRILLKN